MSIHFIAAIAFFLAIMVVNIYTVMDMVKLIEDEGKKAFWTSHFQLCQVSDADFHWPGPVAKVSDGYEYHR